MFRHLFVALMLSAAMLAPVSHSFAAAETTAAATAATPSPFNDKQRAALDAAIKQYILDNPQVLISSVEAYYKTQTDAKQVQEGNITQFPAGLLDYPGTPIAGDKNAKVSVIEFFDYNCGYCKQVATDFKRLIADEPNVRYVFKELPILSETSEVAARYALASNLQGKYLAYHDALMTHQGGITEEYLLATAKDVGLNVDKLKTDANTQDVRDQLAKNVELARELGVRGTPFFVIGKQKIPGAVGFTKMKETIAQERGDTPAPAAAAPTPAATPLADDATASTSTDAATTTDAAPVAPAVIPPAIGSGVDSDTQREIIKARTEATQMIDEMKQEAAKMQQQAVDLQKQAKAQMEAQKAKQDAEAAKTAAPAKK